MKRRRQPGCRRACLLPFRKKPPAAGAFPAPQALFKLKQPMYHNPAHLYIHPNRSGRPTVFLTPPPRPTVKIMTPTRPRLRGLLLN